MEHLKVGILNDSFPPTIDGVANVAVNYARVISSRLGEAVVATPWYPDVVDDYPFEVVRYPSVYIKNDYGYRTGYPFDPKVLTHLEREDLDILHVHCPCVSGVLARVLRANTGAPIVFTYHTKYDIDINNLTANDMLRRASIKALVANISACDDVWVVSEGAGENLRSLGYEGDYIVMPNGTDFERGVASESAVRELREKHGIADGETVFLFVGRMMWYKGLKLSLDGLNAARQQGAKFRFLLVGGGGELEEIKQYTERIGMSDCCVFTGAVRDRELLRAYFTLADLFLFPSTFDTNGIVVREAAACGCPSLLIKGSCAAEGVSDGETGLIIEERPDELAQKALWACSNRDELAEIGKNASARIYLSWDDAVAKAYERYCLVLEREARREDESVIGEALSAAYEQIVDNVTLTREQMRSLMWNTRDWVEALSENVANAAEKAVSDTVEATKEQMRAFADETKNAVEQLKEDVTTALRGNKKD